MVFIINIINKEIADTAILGNKQCSMRVGLDVQVGYDRVSKFYGSMVRYGFHY